MCSDQIAAARGRTRVTRKKVFPSLLAQCVTDILNWFRNARARQPRKGKMLIIPAT